MNLYFYIRTSETLARKKNKKTKQTERYLNSDFIRVSDCEKELETWARRLNRRKKEDGRWDEIDRLCIYPETLKAYWCGATYKKFKQEAIYEYYSSVVFALYQSKLPVEIIQIVLLFRFNSMELQVCKRIVDSINKVVNRRYKPTSRKRKKC